MITTLDPKLPGYQRRVFLTFDELTAGTAPNTYTIGDASATATLGTGAEIIVIDKPGMMLFWSADDQLAYDWTGA